MVRVGRPRPRMSTPGQRCIRTGHAPPLVATDVVDVQIAEKLRHRSVEILTTKEQQDVAVVWRGHESRSAPRSWRAFAHDFSHLKELLLLATILLEDLVQINIFGVASLDLGSLGFGLLFALAGLLGRLLGLRKRQLKVLMEGSIYVVRGTFLAFLASLPFFLSLAIIK